MTNNQKQKILTAVIETYGTSVTRKNLIEFEQAGGGNCAFIGALYRSGRGTYAIPADSNPISESVKTVTEVPGGPGRDVQEVNELTAALPHGS